MSVQIVVAQAVHPERLIGLDGGLPWRNPDDLKRFWETVEDTVLVMGAATWATMPKRRLAQQLYPSAVITKTPLNPDRETHCYFMTLERAAEELRDLPVTVSVIGGAKLCTSVLAPDSPLRVDEIDMTYIRDSREWGMQQRYFPSLGDEWAPDRIAEYGDAQRVWWRRRQ